MTRAAHSEPEASTLIDGEPQAGLAGAEPQAAAGDPAAEQEPGQAAAAEDSPNAEQASVIGDADGNQASGESATVSVPSNLVGEAFEAAVQSAAALLFASPESLSRQRLIDLLSEALGTPLDRDGLDAVLAELSARFQRANLPIALREFGAGLRLYTEPRLSEVVTLLDNTKKSERISPAALETLAIVAYRQPVSKAEIEAIRGVQAGPMLRLLVDRGLLKISGRADQPGAPLLYATTKEFLDRFGLARIEDLPRDAELARD